MPAYFNTPVREACFLKEHELKWESIRESWIAKNPIRYTSSLAAPTTTNMPVAMRHTDISFDGYRPQTTTLGYGDRTAVDVLAAETRRNNFMAISHTSTDADASGAADEAEEGEEGDDGAAAADADSTARPAVAPLGITAALTANTTVGTGYSYRTPKLDASSLPPILANLKSTAPMDSKHKLARLNATTAAAFLDSLPAWFGTSTAKMTSTAHADFRLPIQIQSLRKARETSLHKLGLGADSPRRNAPQGYGSLRSVQMSNGQVHHVSYGVHGRRSGLTGRVHTAPFST